MDMLRHAQPDARVPPCPIENQNNFLVGTSPHFGGKRFELLGKKRDASPRTMAPIPYAVGPFFIVSARNLTNPVG
jgi:hypothetical protein